ncbi:hypothetical protein GCM10023238_26250 [Streptomyces heliomycini]
MQDAVRPVEDVLWSRSDTDGHALVHVHIALLAVRSDETRPGSRGRPGLLRPYVKPAGGLVLHASAEVATGPVVREVRGE